MPARSRTPDKPFYRPSILQCTDWRPPHVRVYGCGLSINPEPVPVAKIEWSAFEPHSQLRAITKGSMRVTIGRDSVEVGPGNWLNLPMPSRDMVVEPASFPLEFLWAEYVGDPALRILDDARRAVGVAVALGRRGKAVARLRKLVATAREDSKRNAFFWSELAHSQLSAFWAETLDAASDSAATTHVAGRPIKLARGKPTSPMRIDPPPASALLREQPRTVKELATKLGYSRSYLSTVISKSWRETPGAVMRRDRLQRAATLLHEGRPVKEVAVLCGYASHQTFGRAYKKHFGRRPSEERGQPSAK